jgi:enoyl-CoA hydratase/carnithine racemase
LGPNRGRHFLLTGSVIDATEAERLGVVGEVLTAEELMPRALELAENLAAMNPLLLRYSRQVMIQPLKKAMLDQLQLGLALEALASISGRDEPA